MGALKKGLKFKGGKGLGIKGGMKKGGFVGAAMKKMGK